MVKHNKIKNTGIIFEVLIRQLTSDVLNNKAQTPAVKIIKEHFKSGSQLKKELNLYRGLFEEKFSSEAKASKFLDLVLKEQKTLNNLSLRREKYNLIKTIQESYDINDFFKTRINEYKIYASIYRLFNSEREKVTPKTLTESYYTLVDNLQKPKVGSKKTGSTELLEQSKDVKLLSYKILVDKFNSKYGDKLDENQRNLLSNYISNVSKDKALKTELSSQIGLISRELSKTTKKIDNKAIQIKLKEISSYLKNMKNLNIIKETHILSLMRFHELIRELKNVNKKVR